MSACSVVDKVKKRIEELEQAIQRLDFVKHHLNQNSSEIKSQIHTSISRHLETLRNREVWLLGQVDTVLGVKEEVLHRQQARLNKAVGILHSSVAHASTTDDETAAKHLAQTLEELTSTELKAEETPYIAFRADHVALRESILSYGRVDAKGLPLQSAFADFSKPSASLPRHLEEYEDSEHHVFYKTLQDGKPGVASIQVSMPKLSTRVEDWLQRPMLHLSTSISEPKVNTAGKLALTPVTQTCSIQNWLSQIKHNPDVEEEDDFEIVDHSGSSQRDSPIEDVTEKPEPLDPFRHIPQDARLWLLKGSNSSPKEEDLRAFFKHIPKETNMWLLTAQRQLESLEHLKNGNLLSHIPKETSTWLRRAHDKQAANIQTAFQDFFAHITRDKNFWLRKKTEEPVEIKENASVRAAHAPSPKAVTSSPELLTPIPNLMEEYVKKMPSSLDSWLSRKNDLLSGDVAASAPCVPAVGAPSEKLERSASLPGIKRFLEPSPNTSAWLLGPVDDTAESTSRSSFFSHISQNKSDWLKNATDKDTGNPARPISLQKIAWEDVSKWLKSGYSSFKETSSSPSVSPLDSLRHAQRHMTTADWLCDSGRENESLASEKSWSVVSSSTASSSSGSSFLMSCERPAPPLDLASWIYQKHL